MSSNQDAKYHRNYRIRVKERKRQQQEALEGILSGDELAMTDHTPISYLMSVMNDRTADPYRRDRAAVALAPYFHKKVVDVPLGKKEGQELAAELAAAGKFAPEHPPRLVVNNTKPTEPIEDLDI